MNRNLISLKQLLAAVVLLGGLSAASARADDAVANPNFTVWSKFKPGSSQTMVMDADTGGKKVHVELTRTLISVADDKVVIETKMKMEMMGHPVEGPGKKETFPATVPKALFKQVGEESIDAAGKTFKCKVMEGMGDKSAKAPSGAMIDQTKGKAWVSEEVPGGIVKIEVTGKDGKPLTFNLTAMEVK